MVNHQTRNTSASLENIYSLDGRVPLLKSVPFGLQHVLAMFVANIAPIMIVAASCNLDAQATASLIQTAMIMAGIGTRYSCFPCGSWARGCPSSWASALRLYLSSATWARSTAMRRS